MRVRTSSVGIIKNRFGKFYLFNLRTSDRWRKLLVYQKDGKGNLHRLYKDRILRSYVSVDEKSTIKCECGKMIAHPMVYEKEKRSAFRLIPGAYSKHNHA